ncbi:MAG: hypothetical protein JHC95_11015 [Solirubrobacteraceae bacterium]|nr:hypothetical protein [Solirubrobacteraceae bacterium]
MERVLIVGAAGALGQVFTARLAGAGAQVDVLVRPGRADEARRGWTVWEIRRWRRARAVPVRPRSVITDVAEARGGDYDWVLLCVSSPALREPWLGELAAATGPAPIAMLGQAAGDRAAVAEAIGDARTVSIVTALLAWTAPLRDEAAEGIAFWVPPGSVRLVGGDPAAAGEVAGGLRAGGLRARYSRQADRLGVRLAARTIPLIVALESCGWSGAALRRSGRFGVAVRAAAEADAVLRGRGRRPSRTVAWPTRLGFRAAMAFPPFDAEAYVERHFTKVSAQSRLMLDEWIRGAESLGWEPAALRELASALGD